MPTKKKSPKPPKTAQPVAFAGKTYLVFVLDKSGSMSNQTTRAIAGFNEFLTEQRKIKDNTSLTLTLFDTLVTDVYTDIALDKAMELDAFSYRPDGYTALYDAVGRSIRAIEKKVSSSDRVIVTIFTDGQENSSREYSSQSIRALITDKEKEGNWTFAFMGVDKDAWVQGASLGIQVGNIAAINLADISQSTAYSSGAVAGLRKSANVRTASLYNPPKQ